MTERVALGQSLYCSSFLVTAGNITLNQKIKDDTWSRQDAM